MKSVVALASPWGAVVHRLFACPAPPKAFDALVDELSRYLPKLPAEEAAALLPRELFALAHLFPALNRLSVVADAPQKVI